MTPRSLETVSVFADLAHFGSPPLMGSLALPEEPGRRYLFVRIRPGVVAEA
jgi:hypothetical protein